MTPQPKDTASPREDIIHLLPDSVANQIAAGEVIQRPASVIKELVENAVDAGATSIEIVVKDAGKTLIQIVDNGCGMSVTDARMAFERHATSKIRCADDLFTLHTMGFRGEALPSVAAVAEVEVITRREGDELGTRLVIRGSKFESQEPCAAAKGTSIKVKNLFYNFVARRRFLKSDSVELKHIVGEFERLALVNKDVAFKFTSNDTLLHSLSRSPLKERISALFGKNIGANLIPVETETSLVKISGFVALPAAARKNGLRQFLFVNGRNMRHPYFHRAILSCYENLIAKDVQPHYFINFEVSPDRIDVNIHPQKHEIKFEDEQSIWQILTAAVRASLGRFNVGVSIEFNTEGAPDIPPLIEGNLPEDNTPVSDVFDETYNPFELKSPTPVQHARFDFGDSFTQPSMLNSRVRPRQEQRQDTRGWEEFYRSVEQIKKQREVEIQPQSLIDSNMVGDESTTSFWQFLGRYILTETRAGIVIIDQHRAHINILYNQILGTLTTGASASQKLMFDEPLELDTTENVVLDSSIDIIESMGFRIHRNDEGKAILEAVPAILDTISPVTVLKSILADLAETGNDVERDLQSRVALAAARSSAIRYGQTLTPVEMEYIVNALFRLASPTYTPDGQLAIYLLDEQRLNAIFKTGMA